METENIKTFVPEPPRLLPLFVKATSVIEVLQNMLRIFKIPNSHTKGVLAIDGFGKGSGLTISHNIIKVCIFGGIERADNNKTWMTNRTVKEIGITLGFFDNDYIGFKVISWNNAPERTQQDIVQVIEKTIERLKN